MLSLKKNVYGLFSFWLCGSLWLCWGFTAELGFHCRALDAYCKLQSTGPGHRPQGAESRAQAPGHRPQDAESRAQTPGRRPQGAESRVQAPGRRPQSAESRAGRLQQVWHTGLADPKYVGSSWTRD